MNFIDNLTEISQSVKDAKIQSLKADVEYSKLMKIFRQQSTTESKSRTPKKETK